MAFFGLTALGPQNSFAIKSRQYRTLQIFSEDDFSAAWKKVVGNVEKHCYKSKIPEIMKNLFHGPTPENEVDVIDQAFSEEFETPDTVSYLAFITVMNRLRDEAELEEKSMEGKPKPSCDFDSSKQFNESVKKNDISKLREVKMKQNSPMTGTQDYGWEKQTLQKPIAGREGSDITKFAAELVKNGIYY